MNSELVRIAIQRFFEHIITCIIISAILTFFHVAEVIISKEAIAIFSVLGVVLYMVENVRMLRGCYFELKSDVAYILVNIPVYILFVLVTMLFYWLTSVECYTWLFAITKFVKYVFNNVETFKSLLIFHAIGLLTIFIAPTGMNWIFKEVYETFEDEDED